MNQSPPPLPGSAPTSTLTPEQRDRIARHRAQAIARRSARLAHQSALAGNVEAMDWQPSPVDPASSSIDQAHPGARIDRGTNILDHRGIDSSSPSLIVDQAMTGQNIFDPRSVDQARIDPGRDIFDSRSIDQTRGRIDPDQNRIAVDGDDKTANKPVRLSVEQIRVLEAVADGKSVFVTGSAGTGKSFILDYAIKALRLLHGGSAVFVTASTGIAACAIGGTTLHSFAGIGLGEKEVGDLVAGAMRSKDSKSRWRDARALVIDEISMIDGELLDKIDQVGRAVRGRSDRPFGGLQLLVTGDFFQLPPVQKGGGRAKIFAFQAECWRDCFDLQMELKYVFRQSDRNFVAMLDEIRRGQCSDRTIEALQACGGGGGGGEMAAAATKLFPVLSMVDRVNHEKLAALTGEKVTFFARDVGNAGLLRDCRAETEITLAAGAEVMLVKNIDTVRGLVNGARGVLIEFLDPRASRRDLDCYCMEEQEIDERVRSFEEHRWDGGDPAAMERRSSGRVIEERGEQRRWPVVEFRIGGRLRRVLVNRQNWSVMEGDREVATRNQIPLVLAWALSIHKCQGMTLDRVETDLTRSFGCGMVYVALSRARSLEGIRLRGFNPLLIKVDPNVLGFYNQLERQRQ